jgi:transposase-like protein
MVMSDKVKYRYTCKYCGRQWELSYQIKYPTCHACKDQNIKCEEIIIKDYYGSSEIDYEKLHWWTWRD